MKIRTEGDLEDLLDQELAWRRTELQSMLTAVRTARGRTSSCFRRAGVALLYAHWEGFAKAALTAYWDFVANKRLKHAELAPNFVALSIEAELAKRQGMRAATHLVRRAERFLASHEDRAYMQAREINTKSNLNSEVLEDLLCQMGIEASPFATKAALIDRQLLKARNQIAHGEYLDVSEAAYEELHFRVMELLSLVHNLVGNAAAQKAYAARSART